MTKFEVYQPTLLATHPIAIHRLTLLNFSNLQYSIVYSRYSTYKSQEVRTGPSCKGKKKKEKKNDNDHDLSLIYNNKYNLYYHLSTFFSFIQFGILLRFSLSFLHLFIYEFLLISVCLLRCIALKQQYPLMVLMKIIMTRSMMLIFN